MEPPLLLPTHTVQGVVLPHFTGARLHSRPSQAWQLNPGVSPQQPLPDSGLPIADLEAQFCKSEVPPRLPAQGITRCGLGCFLSGSSGEIFASKLVLAVG